MPASDARPLLVLVLLALARCTVDATPVSPLLLPTRIPRTPTVPAQKAAQSYYETGLACQEAGDAECALQYFAWAIQVAPDFSSAYRARGTLHLAQGRLDEALADADRALSLDPSSALTHALRGEVLRLLGRSAAALRAFDRAVALDPSLGEAVFRSRWLATQASDEKEPLMRLSREYSEAHPADPIRHYYRGWAFIELEQPHVAVSILRDGIEQAAEPPALLWFALGHAYLDDQFWQEAVISFEAALTLVGAGDGSLELHSDQPLTELFGGVGRAYLGVGRCADAEAMLEHAIAIGAPASAYDAALEEARLCQVSVPASTPEATALP